MRFLPELRQGFDVNDLEDERERKLKLLEIRNAVDRNASAQSNDMRRATDELSSLSCPSTPQSDIYDSDREPESAPNSPFAAEHAVKFPSTWSVTTFVFPPLDEYGTFGSALPESEARHPCAAEFSGPQLAPVPEVEMNEPAATSHSAKKNGHEKAKAKATKLKRHKKHKSSKKAKKEKRLGRHLRRKRCGAACSFERSPERFPGSRCAYSEMPVCWCCLQARARRLTRAHWVPVRFRARHDAERNRLKR